MRLLAAAICAATAAQSVAAGVQLIPRELLFGAPKRSLPQLSPDGSKLAYLARDAAGSMHIWLSPSDNPKRQGSPLTSASDGGVFGFRWAEDNVHIIFWRDNDGDENWRLAEIDIRNRRTRNLTPAAGVKAQNLLTDARHPHELLVGLNIRDRSVADMYRINLDTGAMTLDTQNPGDVIGWTADSEFHIRGATAFLPNTGATVLRVRPTPASSWRDVATWPFDDGIMLGQVNGGNIAPAFTADGKAVLAVSTSGSDSSRLVKIDVASGRWSLVAGGYGDVADELIDVPARTLPGDSRPLTMFSPVNGALQAVAFEHSTRSWHAIDPAVGADLKFLHRRLGAFPFVVSRDRLDRRWIVASWAGDRPLEYSLYTRATHRMQPLFSEHPELRRHPLPAPVAKEITARDGLEIPIYLTRKAGNSPAPLILFPHGGPWFRDHLDFDPIVQLFADRGYAVLQVEYRGSTGFGKSFLNSGNNQFGLGMRDDLIDATEWAIRNNIADPKRVGVFGISAGGYLALRVTEARPDLYGTTIDVVGPTDVKVSIEELPATWGPVRTRWLRRIGDVIHDDALNERLSPRFASQKPRSAFLIAQGANDSRVDPRDSDRITTILRSKGARLTYLVYLDEGHIFTKPENNLDFFGRVEEFLAATLGGKAQPWTHEPRAKVEINPK